MANEYKLNFTASDIEAKLSVIDGAKTYYSSEEVNEKIRTSIPEVPELPKIDEIPTEDSENLITSGGVYKAIQNTIPNLTFDSVPTEGSENLVKSGDIYTAIQSATPNLTFDETPIEGSENLITSGGIYKAFQNVDLTAGDGIEIKDGIIRSTLTFDDVPIKNSDSLITSGTIYDIIGDINSVIDSINTLIGGEFE